MTMVVRRVGARVSGWAARLQPVDGRTFSAWAVNAVGTGILAATLLTTRTNLPWVWAVLAAGLAGWLVFVVCERRAPRVAMAALVGCALLAASAAGPGDGSGIMIVGVLLFASSAVPPVRLIAALLAATIAVATISGLTWRQPATTILLTVGSLLVVGLVGLNRRQHAVQARQTELLLEQTRRAQHERARAAALDERARIAREMHDVLAHSLGALGMQLEVAEALLDRDDPDAREQAAERVRRSRRLAVDGLAEARRAVAALRGDVPPVPDALRELADAFRRDHHAPIACRVTGETRPLPPAAADSLVRGAREALTNAARHAPGAAVTILLDYRPDTVALTVRNDRTPGAPDPTPNGGFGLPGMRERVALAGGTLTAGDGADGWVVHAEVPG
ncbi:MAG TPA: sensor histidine kinase [Streptosporangiaceae bacterium]|jgi:signal transduction histidine kinase